jgi:pseudouridine-5'-phosphate glycosidase
MNKYIEYSPEVLEAIQNNKPIVALESTIISHGMPYPQNAEVAKKCQSIIRENGCTPATIAIIKGKLKIGLTDEEAFSTIRISTREDTTTEECDEFVRILGECLVSLKMLGGE